MGVDFSEPHPSPDTALTFFQDKGETGPLETMCPGHTRFSRAAEANEAQEPLLPRHSNVYCGPNYSLVTGYKQHPTGTRGNESVEESICSGEVSGRGLHDVTQETSLLSGPGLASKLLGGLRDSTHSQSKCFSRDPNVQISAGTAESAKLTERPLVGY